MRALALALVVAACGSATTNPSPLGNTGPRSTRQTFTVAIVVNGWEIWMGNELTGRLDPDDPSHMRGAWPQLRTAFETANLARNAGSRGTLIVYADKATTRVPMGPIERITPNALGTQNEYFGTTGVALVAGVRLAAARLLREPAGRKVMIVIGDGVDTNNETAKPQLAAIRRELEAAGVKTIAIVYKTQLSLDEMSVASLTDHVITVGALDDLGATVAKVFDRLPR